MKKYIHILIVIIFLVSGCSVDQKVNQPYDSEEILDPHYNSYNLATVSDGEYIFYADRLGIYKMPLNNGKSQRILSTENDGIVKTLALHNSMIYYFSGANLYRMDKDGYQKKVIETDVDTTQTDQMVCLQDTLYISIGNNYFSAEIAYDPDKLELQKISYEFPTPKGAFYKMEPAPASTVMITYYNLYRIYPDKQEKDLIINGDGELEQDNFIVTDQFIFYIKDAAIWRCDLSGDNQIEMTDLQSLDTFESFINYDDEWIYYMVRRFEHGLIALRMNQTTGKTEEYLNWEQRYLDIIDDCIYGFDANGKKLRMKVSGSNVEYSPFE